LIPKSAAVWGTKLKAEQPLQLASDVIDARLLADDVTVAIEVSPACLERRSRAKAARWALRRRKRSSMV